MSERLFDVVEFKGARLLKYADASHPDDRSLRADLFLSHTVLNQYEGGYAQIVPRSLQNGLLPKNWLMKH